MKWLLRMLTAGASLLAMTSAALADPFSIGVAISSAFLSTTGIALAVSPALIGSVALAGLTIGGQILASAFAKPQGLAPQEYKNTFETSDSSEIRAVGRVRVSGLKAFGNTRNDDRWRLICHTKGPVSAVEEHFLGGREVVVDSDGRVASPPYVRRNGSYIYVYAKRGDGSETAWPQLVSEFPSLWTIDHRVRGIAQSLVNYESPGLDNPKFLKLYQSGEPSYERVQRCEPVYDPRDGTQGVDSPASWKWSDNGILCAAHILRSYPSFSSADFDWAGIGLEATKADANVATRTGTEKRARCWGFWGSESTRGDVVADVIRSIGAEIVTGDTGLILIRLIEDQPSGEILLPARHIYNISRKYGPESVERPNICRVRYYSPERNYELSDIDMTGIAWARVDDEVDRVGEQPLDVELPFCPSASQAQRIARRLFASARADTGTANANFAGLATWGRSMIDIEFPDLADDASIVQTCAISSPRVDDAEGRVEIPFVVWPVLTAFNPALDEAAAPDIIPDLQYEADIETPIAPGPALAVLQGFGATPFWELRVAFRLPDSGGSLEAEANYRLYQGDLPDPWQSMDETNPAAGGFGLESEGVAYLASDLRGQRMDVRVRAFDSDDDSSNFSDNLSVTALGVDNTACAMPTVTAGAPDGNGNRTMTVRAGELRAAYVTLNNQDPKDIGRGRSVTYQVRYGTFSFRTHTSDGTASSPRVFTYVDPN